MKQLVIIFLASFYLLSLNAQNTYPSIVDSRDKTPITSASLVILDSLNNIIATGLTNEQGQCIIKGGNKNNYNSLQISCIGYSTRIIPYHIASVKDTICLDAIHTELAGIVVKAKQSSFVKLSPGMFCYEIEKDSDALKRSTFDVMYKVPLLIVSQKSGITAESGKNIIYELNGMRNPIFNGDITKVLQALKASSLKRIEVNALPGLQYGLNTIVVNFVTKGHLEGVLGNITTKVSDQNWNSSLFCLTKYKNFAISMNYQNIWDYGHARLQDIEETRDESQLYYFSNKTVSSDGFKSNGHSLEMSTSYEASNTTLLNFYGRIILNSLSNPHENTQENATVYKKDGALSYAYARSSHRLFKNTEYDATISMEHSFVKNLMLNGKLYIGYNFYNRPYRQITTSNYEHLDSLYLSKETLNEFYNYIETENLNAPIHTFEANVWHKIGLNHRITLGGKYVVRPQSTDRFLQKYLLSPNPNHPKDSISSFYDHNQQVATIYGSYSYSANKVKLDLGIRYEYQKDKLTHSGNMEIFKKSFSNVLPSVDFAYQPKDNLSMEVSYAMNVERPNIAVLDPYIDQTMPLQLSYGNKDLKPENSNVITFTINRKIKRYTLITSLNHTVTDKIILNYQYLDNQILHNTTGNLGKKNTTCLYHSFSGRVSRRMYARLMQSLSYTDYDASVIGSHQYGWAYFVKAFVEYELPKDYYVNMEGSYHTKSILLQGRGYESYYYSLSLSKYCFNNNLRLSISADNFFHVYKTNHVSKFTNGCSSVINTRNYQALVMFNATFSFGSLKAKVKKTDKRIQRDNDIKYNYDE